MPKRVRNYFKGMDGSPWDRGTVLMPKRKPAPESQLGSPKKAFSQTFRAMEVLKNRFFAPPPPNPKP